MPRFVDAAGREWSVALTLGAVGRLKRECDFDLGAMDDGTRLQAVLLGDPLKLGDVLWHLVKGNANGTTRDEFDDAFDGPTFDRAQAALSEAIIDFFHPSRAAEVKSRLPKLMAELKAQFAAALNTTSKPSGGDSPASAG